MITSHYIITTRVQYSNSIHLESGINDQCCIQVVKTLTLGLKVSTENNRFALFEQCGRQSKVIDDRTILPDILGKFEG